MISSGQVESASCLFSESLTYAVLSSLDCQLKAEEREWRIGRSQSLESAWSSCGNLKAILTQNSHSPSHLKLVDRIQDGEHYSNVRGEVFVNSIDKYLSVGKYSEFLCSFSRGLSNQLYED